MSGPVLGEGTLKQSLKNALRIMNEVVQGSNKEELLPHIPSLISMIGSHEFDNSDQIGLGAFAHFYRDYY
jgi:hypothetical protein